MEPSIVPRTPALPDRWQSSSIEQDSYDDADNASLAELDRDFSSNLSIDSQSSDNPRLLISAVQDAALGTALPMLSPLIDAGPWEGGRASGGGPVFQLELQGGNKDDKLLSKVSGVVQSVPRSVSIMTSSSQSMSSAASGAGRARESYDGIDSQVKDDVATASALPSKTAGDCEILTAVNGREQGACRMFDLLTESEDDYAVTEVLEVGVVKQQAKEVHFGAVANGTSALANNCGRGPGAEAADTSAALQSDHSGALDLLARETKREGVTLGPQQAEAEMAGGIFIQRDSEGLKRIYSNTSKEGLASWTGPRSGQSAVLPSARAGPASQGLPIPADDVHRRSSHPPSSSSSADVGSTRVYDDNGTFFDFDDPDEDSDAEFDSGDVELGDEADLVDPPTLNPQPRSHKPIKSYADNGAVQRVKLLCSYGGLIVPRPGDGKLRYVGGETRIMVFNRNIDYFDLMFKMTEDYGCALTLKYQLPNEDLDALVSVSSDEDLAHMMEEYDHLNSRPGAEGQARLRVFLFNAAEAEPPASGASGSLAGSGNLSSADVQYAQYIDAINRGSIEAFRFSAPFAGGGEEGGGQGPEQFEQVPGRVQLRSTAGSGPVSSASQLPPPQLPPHLASHAPVAAPLVHSRSTAALLDVPPAEPKSSAHGSPRVNFLRPVARGVTTPAAELIPANPLALLAPSSLSLPVTSAGHLTGLPGMEAPRPSKMFPPVHRAISSERLSGPPSHASSKPGSPHSPLPPLRSSSEQVSRSDTEVSHLAYPDLFESLQRHLWEQQSPGGSGPGTPFSEELPAGIAPPSPRRQREIEQARVMAHELLGPHNSHRRESGPVGVMDGRFLAGGSSQQTMQQHGPSQQDHQLGSDPPDLRRLRDLPRLNVGPTAFSRRSSGPSSPPPYDESFHEPSQWHQVPDQFKADQFQRAEGGGAQAPHPAGIDALPYQARAGDDHLWNLSQGGEQMGEQTGWGAGAAAAGASRQHEYVGSEGWRDVSEPPLRTFSGPRGGAGLGDRPPGWPGGLGREDEGGGNVRYRLSRQAPQAAPPQQQPQSAGQLQSKQQPEAFAAGYKGGGLGQDWHMGGESVGAHSVYANNPAVRGGQFQQQLLGRGISMPDPSQGHHQADSVILSQLHGDPRLLREESALRNGDERFLTEEYRHLPVEDAGLPSYHHLTDSRFPAGHPGRYGAHLADGPEQYSHNRKSAPGSPHSNVAFQEHLMWQAGGSTSGHGFGPDGLVRQTQQPSIPGSVYGVSSQQQHGGGGMGVGGYFGQEQMGGVDQLRPKPGMLDQWEAGGHSRQVDQRGAPDRGGYAAPFHTDGLEGGKVDGGMLGSAVTAPSGFQLQRPLYQPLDNAGRLYNDVAESHRLGTRRLDSGSAKPYSEEPPQYAQQGRGMEHGIGNPSHTVFPGDINAGRPAVQLPRLMLPQDIGTREGGPRQAQSPTGHGLVGVGSLGARGQQQDAWARMEAGQDGGSARASAISGTRDEGAPGESWGMQFLERMGRTGGVEHGGSKDPDPRLQANHDMIPGFTEVVVGQSEGDLLQGRSASQVQGKGPLGREAGGLPEDSSSHFGVWDASGRGEPGRSAEVAGHHPFLPADLLDMQRQLVAQDERQMLPVGKVQGLLDVGTGMRPEGYLGHEPALPADASPADPYESRKYPNDGFSGPSVMSASQLQNGGELPPGLRTRLPEAHDTWERSESSRIAHSRANRGGLPGGGQWTIPPGGAGDEGTRSAPRSRRGSDEMKAQGPMPGGGQRRLEERPPLSFGESTEQGFRGMGGVSQQDQADSAAAITRRGRISSGIPQNLAAHEWSAVDRARQQQIQDSQAQMIEGSQRSEYLHNQRQPEIPDMIDWEPEGPGQQAPHAAARMDQHVVYHPSAPAIQEAAIGQGQTNSPRVRDSRRVDLPDSSLGGLSRLELLTGMQDIGQQEPRFHANDLEHAAVGMVTGLETPFLAVQSALAGPGQSTLKGQAYGENFGAGMLSGGLGGDTGLAAGPGGRKILGERPTPNVVPSMTQPGQPKASVSGSQGNSEVGQAPFEGAAAAHSGGQNDIYGGDKYADELEDRKSLQVDSAAPGSNRPTPPAHVLLPAPAAALAIASVGPGKRGGLSLQLSDVEALANDVAVSVLGSSPDGVALGPLQATGSQKLPGQGSQALGGGLDIPQSRPLSLRHELGSKIPSGRADRHVAEDMAASLLGGSPLGKSPLGTGLGALASGARAQSPSQLGEMKEGDTMKAAGLPQKPVEIPEEVQRAFKDGGSAKAEAAPTENPPVPEAASEASTSKKTDPASPALPGAAVSKAAVAEAEAVAAGLQTIPNADLEELRELGSGTYGTVFHGKWRGTDVAIKRIKTSVFQGHPSEQERLIADFWREACTLGGLHHPNVVAFYGVVRDHPDGTLATVTEYMVNGSLKQVLQKKDRSIDRRKRILIGMDAAFGMEYLHGKNIVHFDLKCDNLLVNLRDAQRPICKVGDLGLSKVKHKTMVSGGVRGTLPWMAPELLDGRSALVTEKVDVFSFGICMWELLTGEEPYASMHYGAIIGGILNNTLRPPIPSWCDPAWKSLMERCWNGDPAERPSFQEVTKELRAMAVALQPNRS